MVSPRAMTMAWYAMLHTSISSFVPIHPFAALLEGQQKIQAPPFPDGIDGQVGHDPAVAFVPVQTVRLAGNEAFVVDEKDYPIPGNFQAVFKERNEEVVATSPVAIGRVREHGINLLPVAEKVSAFLELAPVLRDVLWKVSVEVAVAPGRFQDQLPRTPRCPGDDRLAQALRRLVVNVVGHSRRSCTPMLLIAVGKNKLLPHAPKVTLSLERSSLSSPCNFFFVSHGPIPFYKCPVGGGGSTPYGGIWRTRSPAAPEPKQKSKDNE